MRNRAQSTGVEGRASFAAALSVVFVGLVALAPGCAEGESSERTAQRRTPLQPLVYTEDPELSPEIAAVRERRLMRRLLEGSDAEGTVWGTLEADPRESLPVPDSAETLGTLIHRALVDQSDPHWDHLFVAANEYASLVDVKLEKARNFVDDRQADAREAKRAFAVEQASERPEKGLDSIFSFRRLELGKGRTMDGSVARGDDVAVQHWDNVVYFGLEEHDVELELRIPKILRIQRRGSEGPSARLGVASDIEVGARLEVFLEAGMHLKPELLRSFDYPLPLAVGNYWRYRRRLEAESDIERDDPLAAEESDEVPTRPPDELPEGLTASEATVKVESVDRYGTRRLVRLVTSYNDTDLTRVDEYWLVTPRRVYLCPRPCRRRIDDLEWLLSYLRRQTAIYRFPLTRGETWGEPEGGADSEAAFSVDDEWHQLETPAGAFFGTLAIRGLGPLRTRVPAHRLRDSTRFVAPGKGVVRRVYRFGSGPDETIVESLIDYRLMPR